MRERPSAWFILACCHKNSATGGLVSPGETKKPRADAEAVIQVFESLILAIISGICSMPQQAFQISVGYLVHPEQLSTI